MTSAFKTESVKRTSIKHPIYAMLQYMRFYSKNKTMLKLINFLLLSFFCGVLFAGQCAPKEKSCVPTQRSTCCGSMGGVNYCDSSAGRLVCNNGEYSSCYCERHAVMNLQLLQGCCLWRGGVLSVDPNGVVICQDGRISEECTKGNQSHSFDHW